MSADPLARAIEMRLAERRGVPQITVLRRASPPLVLTGHDLQQRADALRVRWDSQFGAGPLRLVLALPPGEWFLAALLAGILGGHTMVPAALPRLGSVASRLAHIVTDCGADAVLCTGAQLPSIREGLRNATHGPSCPVVAIDAAEYGTHMQQRPQRIGPCAEGPHPVVVQYTSGSTRLPKGVRISGASILANCRMVEESWGMGPETCMVNWLPHYHDMGLMGGILYPLLAGGRSVQMNPLDMVRRPVDWLRAISDHRADFSGGPAFAFAECLRRIAPGDCAGLDLSCWTRAFCGAEPIPAGLLPAFRARFAAHGLPPEGVFGCYGMAEMTLFAAGAPGPAASLGGTPVEPCRLNTLTAPRLRIVDPQSRMPCPEGREGEIWLRGPSKGDGYMNLPEETRQTFHATLETPDAVAGEWLRTGDLGVITGELLHVTGRIKDTLIANGRKVAAAELEWLAASMDDALNPLAAAAFMPDATESARAVLLIELKSGYATTAGPLETVRSSIAKVIAGEWGIHLKDLRILPRGRLLRTSSGKVRRQAMAEAYRAGQVGVDVAEQTRTRQPHEA
ncbi:AMP-binding protein [Meridianimarinicoccus sp. RP-17]|uniref:AMP-binding protein n=1 Tax=Meridianimarinicoccus zhengii TaxID=2056810 RepID=UPI000DABBF25|nr:AMP-binding protein [Phycocomes zhengii]